MTPMEAIDLAIDTLEAILRGEAADHAVLLHRLNVLKVARTTEQHRRLQDDLCRSAIRSLSEERRQAKAGDT